MTRAHVSLLTLALLAPLAASAQPAPRAADACSSPRSAVYTLLYFLQDNEQRNPGRAAACIDRTGLERPASQTPQLAVRLKKVLDARGLYVVMDEIPNDPNYKGDGDQAQYSLFPQELSDMTWEKGADGRWLLTPASRDNIEKLYRDSFPLNVDELVESLPSWLQKPFIGIHLWKLFGLLFIILLALGLHRIIRFVFAHQVRRLFDKVDIGVVEEGFMVADRPLAALAGAGVFAVAFPMLQFPAAVNKISLLGARTLAAGAVVWLGYRLVDVFANVFERRAAKTDTKLDDQLVPLVRKTVKLFLAIVGGIFILQNLSVDVGSLIAGLGIGGLAFALAAKDTVANFFGSLMIFIDKPFQIGDWIAVGTAVEGTVEEVGFRTTRIRTFYNSLITMPNSLITNSAIDNYGMRSFRRYKTSLGLAYDTPPEKVQAFCEGVRAVIASTDGMRKDFYMVEFHTFGSSELNILIYSFMEVPDWSAELTTRTNLNLQILRLAQTLGVSFAFPSQSLYVESTPDHPLQPQSSPPNDELAAIVNSFAPGGSKALPKGVHISPGWHPGQGPKVGSHMETDEDAAQS